MANAYQILKLLLFISRDKMIRVNKYFHNNIGKLWWYKCALYGLCCCTSKKFIQVAKKDGILTYATSDILCQVDAPIPTNQMGHYLISSEDVDKIEKAAQW